MSRNGSGVYSLPAGNPVVTGTTISSSWANTTLSDISTALTGSVASDGQTAMTGNLQMGNNKVTGLAVASATGDALSYNQAATVTTLTTTGNVTIGGTLTLTGGLTLNGNVTVGDASTDTLTVNATSTFAAGATFSSTFAANGGATLGDASGDALTINSSAVSIPNGLNFDSNTLVIDATNNRVGVGTASPSVAFQVGTGLLFNGSSLRTTVADSPYIGLFNGATKGVRLGADSTGGSIEGVDSTGSASYQPLFVGGSDLRFTTSSTERMRITSAGNVGIGTSSPAFKLDVAGVINSSSSIRATGFLASNTNGISLYDDVANGFISYGYNSGRTNAASHIWYNGITTERMRLDSSGNLGLGVTPSAWFSTRKVLQISGSNTTAFAGVTDGTTEIWSNSYINSSGNNIYVSNGYATVYQQNYGNSGAFRWLTAPSGTAGNAITFTQAMTLDASGNLGIGSTSIATVGAYRVVEINGTSGGYLALEQSGTKYGAIGASSGSLFLEAFGASTPLIFYTNGAERMTIDTGGNLLVGETSGYLSSRVLVKTTTTDSSTNALTLRNSASTDLFRVRSDGYTYAGFYPQTTGSAANVFIGSGGDLLRSTSSLKYKQDVQNTVHGLAEVMQLRSVTYKGKSEADGDKVFGGLIAEEVHEAGLTEFVQYAEDGSPDALAYGNMVSLAFKAIQEQQAIITELKARIETLESK